MLKKRQKTAMKRNAMTKPITRLHDLDTCLQHKMRVYITPYLISIIAWSTIVFIQQFQVFIG